MAIINILYPIFYTSTSIVWKKILIFYEYEMFMFIQCSIINYGKDILIIVIKDIVNKTIIVLQKNTINI